MSIIKFLCSIRTYLHAFTEDGVECQQMQRVEMDDWPVFMEPSCETLFMCFMTTFKEGIRAGGGISDVLRKPASHVRICNGKGGKEK